MDAIALLSAMIIDFINRGHECPHVLVVTYLCEIFEWIPKSNLINMQVCILNYFLNLINKNKNNLFLLSQY
jgi:hypothetical protein